MSAKHNYKGGGAWEVAINPNDLRITGSCQIFERDSTSGFEEVPYIQSPNAQVRTNRIIQTDQEVAVRFNWQIFGSLACLLDCGYWYCSVLFELMGGGETSFKPDAITQDVGKPGHLYDSTILIKPNSLKPGVYRVICCVQYCFEDGSPGPICGFDDKGLIKVYQDKRKGRRKKENRTVKVVHGLPVRRSLMGCKSSKTLDIQHSTGSKSMYVCDENRNRLYWNIEEREGGNQ